MSYIEHGTKFTYRVVNDQNWSEEQGYYYKGLVKQFNKNLRIFKTFGEAVKKVKELHVERERQPYVITQTHSGFQLRNGENPIYCGEHKLGLVSYTFAGDRDAEYWCERESEQVKSDCVEL